MTQDHTLESPEPVIEPAERYERGLALKQAGLYKAAIEQFVRASLDSRFSLKAQAQIGICFKCAGRHEDAVAAFRKALMAAGSSKETVQILYVLGRTLESLGRIAETLEAYRWIRRENPGYRDVADRIERLSSGRPITISVGNRSASHRPTGVSGVLKSWQDILRHQR
jgi:tetratricopeptide (TPR) repeat protein